MTLPDLAHPPAVVAFDLDDTLAESKSRIEPAMADALQDLAGLLPVCIISGGRFEQFEQQVLAHLHRVEVLGDLHLMPTCGTRYYRWQDGGWTQVYAHDLSEEDKRVTAQALRDGSVELGLWEDDDAVWGERIEDRGSQVTLSALGQRAPVEAKKAWDPDGSKRERLRAWVAERVPHLEVRSGGSTSIDVTARGIDKAFGIGRLCELLDVDPVRVHFVGDRLDPGGNDHPVLALGVTAQPVTGPAETLEHVRGLTSMLRAGG